MATPVEAPKLGNTVEECIVAKWRKQKGEAVAAGDVIVDIETDKATFEVTAPVDGTMIETFFPEGALVAVFTNLCVIGEPGESVAEFRPGTSGETAPSTPSRDREGALSFEPPNVIPTPGPRQAKAPAPPTPAALSPRARRFAEEHDFHPATVTGSGPGGRVLEEDLRKLYHSTPRLTPAAARRAREGAQARGAGSGVGGRILPADLGPIPSPLPSIREKIARRMRESLASTAQYTLHSSAGAGGLLALRARLKASRTPGINIGDLTAWCAIQALLEFPDLNAELIEGKIYRHSRVHLGFACDTPRGLLVPVVKDAHKLAVDELSQRMKALAAEAVGGSISIDDLSGATFTISNLGGLGIEAFTPLLNPPQVAILGVDAIQVKPMRRNGAIEFIDTIGFSLTCDHQVIDGAPGARFLQVLKGKIEGVESLCTI